jgi:hypothetical protein
MVKNIATLNLVLQDRFYSIQYMVQNQWIRFRGEGGWGDGGGGIWGQQQQCRTSYSIIVELITENL